jgi:hypothetical protein
MKKVFYPLLGQGIIFDSMQDLEENVIPVPAQFNYGFIEANTMTDVFGFWREPILFKGFLKEKDRSNCMVFYLGIEEDLFSKKIHCDTIYLISKTRLFKKYNDLSGRDYNMVNGIWK